VRLILTVLMHLWLPVVEGQCSNTSVGSHHTATGGVVTGTVHVGIARSLTKSNSLFVADPVLHTVIQTCMHAWLASHNILDGKSFATNVPQCSRACLACPACPALRVRAPTRAGHFYTSYLELFITAAKHAPHFSHPSSRSQGGQRKKDTTHGLGTP
jgi:hypothetical protein